VGAFAVPDPPQPAINAAAARPRRVS
jgi:hypothetical protein